MNDNLNGRTILIGREEGNNRLYVTVMIDGKPKTSPYGDYGSVPRSVSRCQPTKGIAHCRIDVDNDGGIDLINLKAANITCVEGVEISKKKITEHNRVTLGLGGYVLDLPQVFEVASKIVDKFPPPPKEYNIDHLQEVWEDYIKHIDEIRRKKELNALLWSLPVMLTMISSRFLFQEEHTKNMVTYVLLIPLVIVVIRYFVIKTKNDSNHDDYHDFVDKYVCPNPECKQYLGNVDFYVLKKKKKCSYCGCRYTSNL